MAACTFACKPASNRHPERSCAPSPRPPYMPRHIQKINIHSRNWMEKEREEMKKESSIPSATATKPLIHVAMEQAFEQSSQITGEVVGELDVLFPWLSSKSRIYRTKKKGKEKVRYEHILQDFKKKLGTRVYGEAAGAKKKSHHSCSFVPAAPFLDKTQRRHHFFSPSFTYVPLSESSDQSRACLWSCAGGRASGL